MGKKNLSTPGFSEISQRIISRSECIKDLRNGECFSNTFKFEMVANGDKDVLNSCVAKLQSIIPILDKKQAEDGNMISNLSGANNG